MNQIELQGQVLGILENFRGMEPLKKLFWSTLNYDQVNKPTSRRGWPDAASSVLADDPMLLAAGGAKGDFQILYSRLAKDRLSLADERIVTSRLLKDHPYGLFVFSDKTQTNWHFLNVKMAEQEEKRKLFRRVTVGPNEKMRTASQVISQLDLESVSPNLHGLSPLTIQERHDHAFDVEPVTEEFYRTYHTTFDAVKSLIKGFRNEERKHLFTQRLFNRLMFIAFIQKKGWLKFGGKQTPDYLTALWADYKKNGDKDMGFYYERLCNLFFHGLGAQDDVGIIKINRGGFFKEMIGVVPYLNGGLFEEDEDDKDGSIRVPDEALKAILHDLFDHFNFTVTEATPLDVEVAVDPEMLGKVFEELVTGRHESGSYYTPKPIVSFMCREALKGYLETALPKENPGALARFVDSHNPKGIHNAEAILEALRRVRTCDPACGSGAYLLGMLPELMALRTCLFSASSLDAISAYDRKLDIIEKNLYGVDIDPFAVNIARLRLWLSLSVEFEGDDPPPLPNLKFEIDEGDSLAIPPHELQSSLRDPEIAHYAEVKGRYIKAHGEKKKELEAEIVALRSNLSTWLHSDSEQEGFDWQVRFADVFLSGGFDIIVANPPYISAIECAKVYEEEYRDHLKSLYRSAKGAYDLFILFFEVGVLCLRPGGLLAFITPNKYLSAKYGSELRSLLLSETAISQIVDLSSVRIFKKASVYPVLTFLRKRPASQEIVRAILPVNRDADEFNIEEYQTAEFPGATLTSLPENIWGFLLSPSTTLLSKLMRGTVQLSTIAEVSATTTAAEADAYGEYLSNTRTSTSVKVINTGTIEPYFTLWGKHPMTHSRAKYITPWLPLARAGVSGRRREMYQSPKIVFAKMAKTCEASLDTNGEYASLNTNCLYRPTKGLTLEYICAFCNSKVFMFIYEQFFGALRMSGGYFQFQSPQLRVMPIKVITPKEQEPFVKRVRSLLVDIEQDKTLEQCRQVAEIDVLFYRLYDLDEKEIAEIEGA